MSTTPPTADAPKKRGPKPLLGANPRDRIHDVALACFERQGVAATSMDYVAKELGVSRPTLYYYFSTKEELLQEVVARQAGAILQDLPHQLTATGLQRVAEAAYLGLLASLENKYVRMMVDGAAAALTGHSLDTPRVLELQRGFWLPLLRHARDNHGMRRDRPLEDVMEWIIFLQFSLAASGAAFGMSEERMRERIDAYLIPALRG